MLRNLFLLFVILTTTACASSPTRSPVARVTPAELEQPCERPQPPQGRTQADYDRMTVENARRHHDCADRVDALVDYLGQGSRHE